MNSFDSRHSQVKYQQGHGDGENAVAQGCEAFRTLARDYVVWGAHGLESSRLGFVHGLQTRQAMPLEESLQPKSPTL